MDKQKLRDAILDWVIDNPGKDAEDIADHFDISISQALGITDELLREGLLAFDE